MLDMGFIPDIKRIMALLPATREAAEPALLGDVLQRDQEARRPAAQRAAADRGRDAATPPPRRSRRASTRCPPDAKRALLDAYRALAQPVAGAVLRAHQARRVAPRAPAREGRPRHRRRSTATRASRRVWKRSTRSRKASCRCWSPPTSPRAASTSTTCRSSSTTSCRTCPRTTSIASAAPAAPAPPARRSRSSRPEEEKYLAEIERLLKKKVPDRRRRRLRPGHGQGRTAARPAPGARPARPPRGEAPSASPASSASRGRPARPRRPRNAGSPATSAAPSAKRAYARNPDQPTVSRPRDASHAAVPAPTANGLRQPQSRSRRAADERPAQAGV